MKASHTLAFCIGLAAVALVMAEMSSPARGPQADSSATEAQLASQPPGATLVVPVAEAPVIDESWYDSPVDEAIVDEQGPDADMPPRDEIDDVISGRPTLEQGAAQSDPVER